MKVIGSVTLTTAIGIMRLESYTTLAFSPAVVLRAPLGRRLLLFTVQRRLHHFKEWRFVAVDRCRTISVSLAKKNAPWKVFQTCLLESIQASLQDTGQPLVDLLNHVNENGKVTVESCCRFYYILSCSI